MNCSICGSSKINRLGVKNNFLLYKCLDCGHWFADVERSFKNISIENFSEVYCNYSKEDAENEYKKLSAGERPGGHCYANIERLMKRLELVHFRGSTLLDVGCGSGFLLGQAKKKGFTVQGVEPGPWGRLASQKWNVPVESSFLRPHHFGREFDLVTALDVIEHQSKPLDFLNVLARNLRIDGICALSFPCVDSFNAHTLGLRWHMVVPPTHCQFFSLESIKQLANACNFEIIDQVKYNIGGFPLLSRSKLFTYLYSKMLNKLNLGDQMMVLLKPVKQ